MREIDPMLASSPKDQEKELKKIKKKDNWIAEEKIDGSRYVAELKPDKTVFQSRTGKVYEDNPKLNHINFAVPELDGTILDGEYDGRSAESLSKNPYYVLDVIQYKGKNQEDKPLYKRKLLRDQVVEQLRFHYPKKYIKVPESRPAKKADEFFKEIVDRGGEGIVLKNLNSKYEEGKESKDWEKIKKNKTYDVVITDVIKSTSQTFGPSGLDTFKSLEGSVYNKRGKLVPVTHIPATSFTHAQHKNLDPAALYGKVAEVEAMGIDSQGKLRHPRFIRWRPDKPAKDCRIS